MVRRLCGTAMGRAERACPNTLQQARSSEIKYGANISTREYNYNLSRFTDPNEFETS